MFLKFSITEILLPVSIEKTSQAAKNSLGSYDYAEFEFTQHLKQRINFLSS